MLIYVNIYEDLKNSGFFNVPHTIYFGLDKRANWNTETHRFNTQIEHKSFIKKNQITKFETN